MARDGEAGRGLAFPTRAIRTPGPSTAPEAVPSCSTPTSCSVVRSRRVRSWLRTTRAPARKRRKGEAGLELRSVSAPGRHHPDPPGRPPPRRPVGPDHLAGAEGQGLRHPAAPQAPASSYHRFEADFPNECWQADVTHVVVADDVAFEVFIIIEPPFSCWYTTRASGSWTQPPASTIGTSSWTRPGTTSPPERRKGPPGPRDRDPRGSGGHVPASGVQAREARFPRVNLLI